MTMPAHSKIPCADRAAFLRELAAAYQVDGLTSYELGRIHQVTANTVCHWLEAAGVPRRDRTEINSRRVVVPSGLCGDYAAGVPINELCRRYYASPPTLYRWLHLSGATVGLRPPTFGRPA